MKHQIPKGSFNAHWYTLFGAVSFQITMGAPIFVYAKSLGASSTILGIIAGSAPLLGVLQLFAAKHLARFGYRRFTLIGWLLRALLIGLLATTPVAIFIDANLRLEALLVVSMLLSFSRGIFSTAWMPWMCHLIAEEDRGHFLSVDQFFMNCGNLISLLFTALLITGMADPWEYSLVFSVAAAACIVATYFIAKTPDAATGTIMQLSETRVPLKEMITYRPFRELVIFNVIYATVIGSFGVFTVEYLHDHSGFGVRSVLALSACAFVGALVVVPLCGRIIDTTSSKRLMLFANGLLAIAISAWILISTNRLPCTHPVAAGLNLASGVAAAIFNIANIRMAMAIMPETGRNYFFACFTVITSFGLAGAPIAWGILLDLLASYEIAGDPFHWQRHSIYFVALLATEVVAIAWVSRLHEFSPRRTGHVWSRR